mmetsp:Transcript_80981/g.185385  ORF Transcript_80981/g.185385 Transcript_80981/m.185385 type:complete len:730 (-) Transcript_80981:60-2249(-)
MSKAGNSDTTASASPTEVPLAPAGQVVVKYRAALSLTTVVCTGSPSAVCQICSAIEEDPFTTTDAFLRANVPSAEENQRSLARTLTGSPANVIPSEDTTAYFALSLANEKFNANSQAHKLSLRRRTLRLESTSEVPENKPPLQPKRTFQPVRADIDAPWQPGEVVMFPPPGFVPYELVDGRMPWTVMPHSAVYQPTAYTEVKMYQVTVDTKTWESKRIAEVPLKQTYVDCNHVGNPFCIIFHPDTTFVYPGAKFEVVVSGLRGKTEELFLFTCFLPVVANDHQNLYSSAVAFRDHVAVASYWGKPTIRHPKYPTQVKIIPAGDEADSQKSPALATVSPTKPKPSAANRWTQIKSSGRLALLQLKKPMEDEVYGGEENDEVNEDPLEVKFDDQGIGVGLVTHPELSFRIESNYVVIALDAPGAVIMKANLISKANPFSPTPVPRCAFVQRFGTRFLARIVLPFAGPFEVQFFIAKDTSTIPIRHPVVYDIEAQWIPEIIASPEHPAFKRFGYAVGLERAGAFGVSIISPLTFCLRTGLVYFLACVHPMGESDHGTLTPALDLQSGRFPLEVTRDHHATPGLGDADQSDSSEEETPRHQRGERGMFSPHARVRPNRANLPPSARMVDRSIYGSDSFDIVKEMRHQVLHLAREQVQQSSAFAGMRIEISVGGGRVVHRLMPRPDFPDLHECVVRFTALEDNSKVEMFIRWDRDHRPPELVGEWVVSAFHTVV